MTDVFYSAKQNSFSNVKFQKKTTQTNFSLNKVDMEEEDMLAQIQEHSSVFDASNANVKEPLVKAKFRNMDRQVSGRCTIDLAKAGIKLAASPIKVSFQDLSYCVKDRYILKNCTGYCLPGHTHYIMGATGAGKTSMLSAISGRLRLDNNHRLEGGRVMLNDQVELTA